jgi:hypothetical protein
VVNPRAEVIEKFRGDRLLAHETLFEHRHAVDAALFHKELIEDFWSDEDRQVTLGFRGCGKSTHLEEGIALAACEGAFRNCIIIGSSETRAKDRIAAISRELLLNELLVQVYGRQEGATWTQTELVLASQRRILALGRDQDIRGIKYLDWRPDLVVVDDFEDKDNVQTTEGRRKTLRWFLAELLPACDPKRKIRVYGTPMDAESVPMKLQKDAGWKTKVFPIVYRDALGEEQASWPAQYPMDWIEKERKTYVQLGQGDVWEREYMCNAEGDQHRTFQAEWIRVVPQQRTWQSVWAMFDPARTMGRGAAMTGALVWSWIGNKLVVWEDRTGLKRPDQIIDEIFDIDEKYSPVEIGVEEDGLHEWINQPLRHEQIKRSRVVPIRPMRAPTRSGRGAIGANVKDDFIASLQPFFRAGEIEFACEMPELRQQLISFPRGRKDGPNTLAYALIMRPGIPVYDGLVPAEHVQERIIVDTREPLWLAVNATGAFTAAVLVQIGSGRMAILADWVREGDPGAVAADIIREASLESRSWLRITAPGPHFDQWNNFGLVQSLRAIPVEVTRAGDLLRGRDYLRKEMGRLTRGAPAFRIAQTARWTLGAIAGGYARKPGANEPEPGIYRTIMEGLECWAGLMSRPGVDETPGPGHAFTADGRMYRKYGAPSYAERRT